jgi:hypothetical protein
MRRAILFGSLVVAFSVLIMSCEPNDIPRISRDGKYAALLLDLENKKAFNEGEKSDKEKMDISYKNPVAIGIIRLDNGKLTRCNLPEGWSAEGFLWAGKKLLVDAVLLIKVNKEVKTDEFAYWLLDPATGKSERTSLAHLSLHTFPFVGPYGNKSCLFIQCRNPKNTTELNTLVLDIGNLSNTIATLKFNAKNAGNGWIIKEVARETELGARKLAKVEVYAQGAKKVVEISGKEIEKACYRDIRSPIMARVSSDYEKILLGFDTETIFRRHSHEFTFGVFGVKTGKHLWGGRSNSLRGIPAFVGNKIFIIEAKTRNIYTGDRTAAAIDEKKSHCQPTGAAVVAVHTKEGRKVALDIPLKKDDLVQRYSCSDNLKKFIVLVEGKNPRLLIIPIKDTIKMEEIVEIPLDTQETTKKSGKK